jgi:allantoin racemase
LEFLRFLPATRLRVAVACTKLSNVMAHIHLVNPNTSAATTELMVGLARAAAPAGLAITGITARTGAALITDSASIDTAAAAVAALAPELTGDGVIVSAFGDPGADDLRRSLNVPVIGIGEASIRAAAAHGRRFSIVTTTPKLEPGIRARVAALGFADHLASIRITTQDPVALTADADRLETALQALVDRCVADDGAQAIIIGGGPLAAAAHAIAARASVAIIEPVPAAVAWMVRRLGIVS